MKSAVETLSATRVRISIDVDFTDLEPHVKRAYQSISERIVIPGFRKGKVPRAMIDQRVGRGAVLDEAINSALPDFYTQAARENEVLVVGRPSVDIKELKDNEIIKFEVEVDVRPEIKLPDFSSIEVKVDDVAVTDKDVEEQIEALRIRFGTLTTVEKDAASGDFVSIDLIARVDGNEVEGGSANGISYEVGSNRMIDGLDAAEEVVATLPLDVPLEGRGVADQVHLLETLRDGRDRVVGGDGEVLERTRVAGGVERGEAIAEGVVGVVVGVEQVVHGELADLEGESRDVFLAGELAVLALDFLALAAQPDLLAEEVARRVETREGEVGFLRLAVGEAAGTRGVVEAEPLQQFRVVVELGALPKHRLDAHDLGAVGVFFGFAFGVVLAVDRRPSLGGHAGGQPQPETEKMRR